MMTAVSLNVLRTAILITCSIMENMRKQSGK